jgi:hypothetical protein
MHLKVFEAICVPHEVDIDGEKWQQTTIIELGISLSIYLVY